MWSYFCTTAMDMFLAFPGLGKRPGHIHQILGRKVPKFLLALALLVDL